MSNALENIINERLAKNPEKFLKLLQDYLLKNGKAQGLDNALLLKINQMNTNRELKQQYKIIATNGRKSEIDLYFDTKDLKIIIELKAGKGKKGNVGFRGAAQAAYYNKCLSDGHHLVVILGNDKGTDYNDFVKNCLKPETQKGLIFLTYEQLKIDPLSF